MYRAKVYVKFVLIKNKNYKTFFDAILINTCEKHFIRVYVSIMLFVRDQRLQYLNTYSIYEI